MALTPNYGDHADGPVTASHPRSWGALLLLQATLVAFELAEMRLGDPDDLIRWHTSCIFVCGVTFYNVLYNLYYMSVKTDLGA